MHQNSAIMPEMGIEHETSFQLLDNLTTAVLIFDKDCRLSCINSACESLLSISNRRVKGLKPDEIIPNGNVFAAVINRSFENKHPYTEHGLVHYLGEGNTITVDCKVTPVIYDDHIRHLIVELIDAYPVQRVLREENLDLLHDAARDSFRGMAHEIKNPLGGIRGAAQLLEQELENEELKEYTRIIIQEADRLHNFIDRVLSSDHQPDRKDTNVHETLERVSQLLAAEFDHKLSIQKDYDPSLPDIYVDQEKIIQALLNVLRNAIQAAGKDGNILIRTRAVRKFTIRQKLHKLVVRIDIIDDGPGVPDEIADSFFYPMITSRAEGTGLGLSIAQSLINLNEGMIQYDRKDEQTCFSIYLPVEDE